MNAVINWLNFMCNMERFATEIYRVQSRAFKETETAEKLNAATENERQHAVNLKACITELNGSQSRLGFLFKTAGRILGFITTLLGKLFILKVDILIEKRAIRDYGNFLKKLELDEKTVDLIKRIIVDEERHVETWQNCIKALKSKN
jgi:bacterioferritin